MKNFFIVIVLTSQFTFSQVGINTTNPQGILHIDPRKNNPLTGAPSASQQIDDFVITSSGAIGIGKNVPDTSSVLDMSAIVNKGILIPTVTLTSNTDGVTVPSPNIGLLVYNTGANVGLSISGFFYWNGTEWRELMNKSTVITTPLVSALNCSFAFLSPATYTSGVPYNGTLTVPYNGGNGTSYPTNTSIISNGLTFTLNSGTLNIGDGQLTYTVTGTPTVSSPTSTNIALNFGGKSCTAIVGNTSVIKQLKYSVNTVNYTNVDYQTSTVSTLGTFQVRFDTTPFSGNTRIAFRFTDTNKANIIYAGQKFAGNGSANVTYNYGNTVNTVANTWTQMNSDSIAPNITNHDFLTVHVFDTNNGVIYRISINALNTNSTTGKASIFIEMLEA